MPQRFFRPGIRTSARWNSVSRDAQALYIAILTLVDDFGRYDGRHSVLHGDAFSVWNEQNPKDAVTPNEMPSLCGELQKHGLVNFYEVDGKKCLQMMQWEERIRDNAKEKWPKCPKNQIPQNSAAENGVPQPPSSPPTPTPTPERAAQDVLPECLNTAEFKSAWGLWLSHLKQKRKTPTDHAKELQLKSLAAMGERRAVAALHHSTKNNWQGIFEPKDQSKQPSGPTTIAGAIKPHQGGNY
jgi:type IV secretory pathway VirB10-like protein